MSYFNHNQGAWPTGNFYDSSPHPVFDDANSVPQQWSSGSDSYTNTVPPPTLNHANFNLAAEAWANYSQSNTSQQALLNSARSGIQLPQFELEMFNRHFSGLELGTEGSGYGNPQFSTEVYHPQLLPPPVPDVGLVGLARAGKLRPLTPGASAFNDPDGTLHLSSTAPRNRNAGQCPSYSYDPVSQQAKIEPSAHDPVARGVTSQWSWYIHATVDPSLYAFYCTLPSVDKTGCWLPCADLVPMEDLVSHLESDHIEHFVHPDSEGAPHWFCPLRTDNGEPCKTKRLIWQVDGGKWSRQEVRNVMYHILSSQHASLHYGVPISWSPDGKWYPDEDEMGLNVRPFPQVKCRYCGTGFSLPFGKRPDSLLDHVKMSHPDVSVGH